MSDYYYYTTTMTTMTPVCWCALVLGVFGGGRSKADVRFNVPYARVGIHGTRARHHRSDDAHAETLSGDRPGRMLILYGYGMQERSAPGCKVFGTRMFACAHVRGSLIHICKYIYYSIYGMLVPACRCVARGMSSHWLSETLGRIESGWIGELCSATVTERVVGRTILIYL